MIGATARLKGECKAGKAFVTTNRDTLSHQNPNFKTPACNELRNADNSPGYYFPHMALLFWIGVYSILLLVYFSLFTTNNLFNNPLILPE